MKRALFLLFMSILAASCGNQSVDDGARGVKARHDLIGDAKVTNSNNPVVDAKVTNSNSPVGDDGNGFIKCSQEFAAISTCFVGSFSTYSINSSHLVGQIIHYVEENDFSQALRDLTFTKEEPCKQIETTFSGSFANNLYLKLNIFKSDAIHQLANKRQFGVKNFAPSYFGVANDSLPDNVSRLPNHNFEVSISCPTGMNVSCSPEDKNCDASQALKAKFPDEPCAIKGTNQIFSLYPSGQVIIDFEGTITKIRSLDNNVDEVDIKFTHVVWR